MIRKARIKFICIIMSILLGFFLLISGVTTIVLHNINNRNIDRTLNETIKDISFLEKDNPDSNLLVVKLIGNQIIEFISIDKYVFNEEQINSIVKIATDKSYSSGKINNIYYRITSVNGDEILIAIDMTYSLSSLNNTFLRMYLIFFIIYLILFVIVYLISFSVFEPIQEAFAKQKQFVSNASHELKTPLTIISANADVLKQSQPNQWVENIKSQTERLDTIITDMLEMAKIDEGKPNGNLEEFNLSEEIIKNSLPFDALAFEKGKTLDLDIDSDINYRGDRESIKKIINILLDNAVKYANKNGIIKVTLRKKNGKITLSVYNTGSYVPADQANKIFERFYRFDNSRSRETGGSGLGLSIAKGIAESNKWKISATSRPGEYMIINIIL